MKKIVLLLLGLGLLGREPGFCQPGPARLAGYQAALRRVQALSYDVQRIDTFPDQTVWNHRGRVLLQRTPGSKILGARFLATQQDAQAAYWYNGKTGFFLENKTKEKEADPTPYAPRVLGSPGGQMLVPELLILDPTYQSVRVLSTAQGPLLALRYPDLPKTDELNRTTYLLLDPATQLPRLVRTVSRKAGALTSTTQLLTNVRVNGAAQVGALRSESFLQVYSPMRPPPPPPTGGSMMLPTNALVGLTAPDFKLLDLDNAPVQLSSYRGRPVLLDFWTTWCGPCIKSMPEVEQLRATYAGQGLAVLGLLMDPANAGRAKGILSRQGATYPTVVGDEATEKGYQIHAFPTYVLVGADGNILFSDAGFTPAIEAAVKKALRK